MFSGSYVAMLGGTQTFGKYVSAPYPALVEREMGQQVVNLGGLSARPDFYLEDQAALRVAAEARLAVVQIPGAGRCQIRSTPCIPDAMTGS